MELQADGIQAFAAAPGTTEHIEISQSQIDLNNFFPNQQELIKNLSTNDFKSQELPLARIKKIMKLDEDVKMISAEAPVLFARAADIFIRELTLRAWVHTEDNKRRTLQRNDIAMAVSKNDQFDFLIDIVPRDEIKPQTKTETGRSAIGADQIQYLLQVAQQNPSQSVTAQNTPTGLQVIQLPTASTQGSNQGQQQFTQVQLNNTNIPVAQLAQAESKVVQMTQAPVTSQDVSQQAEAAPQVQLQQLGGGGQQNTIYQQIMTSSGEVQTIPLQLTQSQLQTIQLQMQGKTPGQPIVIQTGGAEEQEQAEGQQPQQVFQIQQLGDGQQLTFVQGDVTGVDTGHGDGQTES